MPGRLRAYTADDWISKVLAPMSFFITFYHYLLLLSFVTFCGSVAAGPSGAGASEEGDPFQGCPPIIDNWTDYACAYLRAAPPAPNF